MILNSAINLIDSEISKFDRREHSEVSYTPGGTRWSKYIREYSLELEHRLHGLPKHENRRTESRVHCLCDIANYSVIRDSTELEVE